jgi:hypothetical protein
MKGEPMARVLAVALSGLVGVGGAADPGLTAGAIACRRSAARCVRPGCEISRKCCPAKRDFSCGQVFNRYGFVLARRLMGLSTLCGVSVWRLIGSYHSYY